MKIVLEGIVSDKTVTVAREGKISPYITVGVDVYRRPEIAIEDEIKIDETRPCFYAQGMFFSARYFEVIHLLDDEKYDSHSTIGEVKVRMKDLRAQGTGLLTAENLAHEDEDTAYVLTPLTDSELKELTK
jgi:hypothetical protein